ARGRPPSSAPCGLDPRPHRLDPGRVPASCSAARASLRPASAAGTCAPARTGANGAIARPTSSPVLVPPAPAAPAPQAPSRPAPKAAAEESGPVTEELNEASFFLEQGLVEEAREVLDTVELVRPGLPRTAALRDRLAALEAGKA